MGNIQKAWKIALFLIIALFPLFLHAQDARAILESVQNRPQDAQAAALLEKNLSNSGDLRPWYLLELARQASLAGSFTKSLEWADLLQKEGVPPAAADAWTWWKGRALEQSNNAQAAEKLYRARLDTGAAGDPALYLAWFRVASGNAEKMTLQLDKAFPLLKHTDPDTFVLSRYLGGLCAVRGAEWAFAVVSFERFDSLRQGRFAELQAWSSFYRAWSLYRGGRHAEAVEAFSAYLSAYPAHERVWQAATAAALSAVQTGKDGLHFAEKAVKSAPTKNDSADSLILVASILIDARRYDEAYKTLATVADGTATGGLTPSAPRALFVMADISFRQNRLDTALTHWQQVISRFKGDPLAEESLYRIAEQWYIAGDWKKASDSFIAYRQAWPNGRFLEQALLYGGEAHFKNGAIDLSLLWWEELSRKYPSGAPAARAYAFLIQAYRAKGEYVAALRMAETWKARYPAEAARDDIDTQIEELTRLKNGESPDAAALLAAYTRGGRANSAEGRVRALALAKVYVADFGKRTEAKTILGEIISFAPASPQALARDARSVFAAAFALLGNIYREDGEYAKASTYLLSAGAYYAGLDGEKSAEAMYGAAASFKLGGKLADARETVRALESTWPSSVWVKRAEILLSSGGNR